ncbi:hypothetical protein AALP_AA2G002400, partial [Arabis alpina]
MIVGICGPAGIGKSTIARALHSLHSKEFQLTCFVDNLMESYPGVRDEYSLKLLLQAELLSKILNLKVRGVGKRTYMVWSWEYAFRQSYPRNGFGKLAERVTELCVFFNYEDDKIVEALLADGNNNLDIKDGLKILANKSLIDVSICGEIMMHKLLQQVGTKVVREEEPWKRKILINAEDICDVLEDEDDRAKQVSGILFDISGISE